MHLAARLVSVCSSLGRVFDAGRREFDFQAHCYLVLLRDQRSLWGDELLITLSVRCVMNPQDTALEVFLIREMFWAIHSRVARTVIHLGIRVGLQDRWSSQRKLQRLIP